MKNKKYHTVGTIPIPNRKLMERGKNNTLSHKYITTYLYGLEQAF
jgi:hypothetical protein